MHLLELFTTEFLCLRTHALCGHYAEAGLGLPVTVIEQSVRIANNQSPRVQQTHVHGAFKLYTGTNTTVVHTGK